MNTHVHSCAPAHTEAKAWSFSDPIFGRKLTKKSVPLFDKNHAIGSATVISPRR